MALLFDTGIFSVEGLSGEILAGAKLYFYASGTSTPQATYSDPSLDPGLANANPVVASADGRFGPIWLQPLNYKIILKPFDDSETLLTRDPVNGAIGGNALLVDADSLTDDEDDLTAIADKLDIQATQITFTPPWSSGEDQTASDKAREQVSVFDWLTVSQRSDVRGGSAAIDLSTALAAMKSDIAAATSLPDILWPEGIYSYSTAVNWNINHLRMFGHGRARLRYTGTDDAFVVDALSGTQMRSQYFDGFVIEAPTTAKNGIRIRNSNGSCYANFNVRGAGATYAGLKVDFAVCTHFLNYTCSANDPGDAVSWYSGTAPQYGIYLNSLNNMASDPTSYCLFTNPVVEYPEYGIFLGYALGNTFVGGTSEGCTGKGMWLSPYAVQNRVFATDFEANEDHDIFCEGDGNEFHGVDCGGIPADSQLVEFSANAVRNKIFGGTYGEIEFKAGSEFNLVSGASYNRNNDGSQILDPNNANRIRDVYNIGTGVIHNAPPSFTSLTIGASPYTYSNTSAHDLMVAVGGGTVSGIVIERGSDTAAVSTSGYFRLCPGDEITITYSGAPTVKVFSA